MGLFSSLFGSSGSDKADKFRQQAVDAFNSIKTPQLADLQVQLNKEVSAGTLTPEQAEAQLLSSNAFNNIKTDPSLTGAAKQALGQLQQIGTQGGMTAIDRAQLQDITNQTNQLAQSRNASVLQNAQQRGIGGSGLELANELSNEQNAANMASNAGTQVAANAQQRALQAIQAAGGLGQSLESQAYGEQANKAQAQNAIDLFNTNTANATNLYNTGTANQAQAQNLANAQNIANTNTNIGNQNKTYNAAQNQTVFQDQAAKAAGIANQYDQWAQSAQNQKNMEQGADMSLLGGALKTGGTAAGFALGGPMGAAAANGVTSIGNGNTTNKNYQMASPGNYNFAEGGVVNSNENHAETPQEAEPENRYSHECYSEFCLHPEHEMDIREPKNENRALTHAEAEPENKSLEDAYNDFVKTYCYGGTVKMADGGMVNIKPASKEPLHKSDYHATGYAEGGKVKTPHFLEGLKKGALHKQLGIPSDKAIPSGKLEKATHSENETLRKRAQFAENAKHWNHRSDGGMVGYDQGGTVSDADMAAMQNGQPTDADKTRLAALQVNNANPNMAGAQNPPQTPNPAEAQQDHSFLEKLGQLLSSHAEQSKAIPENKGGVIPKKGEKVPVKVSPGEGILTANKGMVVPGTPKVPGNSPVNDTVPMNLNPGSIVVPRTSMTSPIKAGDFVGKTLSREDPTSIALRKLRQAHLNQGA